MIRYEIEKSAFFDANKDYCERIEHRLKTVGAECTGFCNSFGYELVSHFTRGKLSYELKFIKYQTTQNGVVVAVDAHEYAGVELRVTGMDNQMCMTVGKSWFMRLFCLPKVRKMIPQPYFVWSWKRIDTLAIDRLLAFLQVNQISKLVSGRRKFFCCVDLPIEDPVALITDVEEIVTLLGE